MATTRRQFLRDGALATLGVGLSGSLGTALAAPAPRLRATTADDDDPVLVVLNLLGGNDGLNTVVPLRQYDRYRTLRSGLAWHRDDLLFLPGYEGEFAVNPGLRPLLRLFQQGKVAIVNGIGCPASADGLFDHEASQQNFQSGTTYGNAPPAAPTGWVGRFLDGVDPGELPAAIDFNRAATLLLTGASSQPLSLNSVREFKVSPSADVAARTSAYMRLQNLAADSAVKQRNNQLRREVVSLSERLQTISQQYVPAAGVTYDPFFGGLMRECAALITANRGLRCVAVGFPGYDTHAAQNAGPPDVPPVHQTLLSWVSQAIASLYDDLVGQGIAHRVVILVFSEFGRRVFMNSGLGTDHGFGSLAFVIGERVKGGMHGDYPDLRDRYLVLDGNLDVHTDFRSLFGTILAKHLHADPGPIFAGDFPILDFL
jgi:uncharacterized protein (DUF1501 family)